MKSLFTIALSFLTVGLSLGQSCTEPEYEFIFQGPDKNITISCGNLLTPSQWQVKANRCWLWSDPIPLSKDGCSTHGIPQHHKYYVYSEVNIRMDLMGTVAPTWDYIHIPIKCNGVVVSRDTIYGGEAWPPGTSGVQVATYLVPCRYPDTLQIYIEIKSTDNQNGFKILSGGSCSNCLILLPIEISSLEGTLKDREAHFDIQVSTDGSTVDPKIILERSEDGMLFSAVPALVSNQGEAYHLVDEDPTNHHPYYRVKAIDDHGEILYSNIVYLRSNSKYSTFSVSPNPVQPGGFIHIDGVEDISTARLYNVQGGSSVDFTKLLQDEKLELPSYLARGLYILEVQSGTNTLHRSSVVIH